MSTTLRQDAAIPVGTWRHDPVHLVVVGASAGAFGAVWAQAELRKVLAASGARVIDGDLPLGHARQPLGVGELRDDDLRVRARDLVGRLVAEVRETAIAA